VDDETGTGSSCRAEETDSPDARAVRARAPDLTEKKMFGGLAFLIAGNMAITASSQGAPWSVSIRSSPMPGRDNYGEPSGDARPADARMAACRLR